MRIMYINSVVDYGSTGKIVRDLAKGMADKGHEVKLVFGRHDCDNTINCFSISDKFATLYHVAMTRMFGRHGLHSNRATRKLIKEIERFEPDVIHLHNLHGYYLNYKLLMQYLKNQSSIKIVWTLHDLWPITGSSAYYSFDGCKEWNQGCVICNNPKEYPASWLIHRQRKNFEDKKKAFSDFENLEIVTVSKWQKKELQKSYLSQYNITPIYNGINFESFEHIEKKHKNDCINLLGVANIWEERKGLNDFIALSKLLPLDYKITLIGLSQKQIKSLPHNIIGITRTSNYEQLLHHYAEADIYLNLSVEETMGMTTVESLASGTPVVVYNQTAVPEIIDDTVGAVVQAGDINGLLRSIEEVLSRDIDDKTCKKFAQKHYNKELMINRYSEIYFEDNEKFI